MKNEGMKANSGALFIFIHAPACFLVFPWGFQVKQVIVYCRLFIKDG